MKLNIITLILFLTASLSICAQQIFFCRSFTEDGEPIDASLKWEIKPSGGEVYILYQNGGEPILDPLCYIFIDKFNSNEYRPFDSKVIKIENRSSWAIVNYEFREEGKYEIYFMNSSQKRLATARVTVLFGSNLNPMYKELTSRYYDNSKFLFADAIIGGKPYNVRTSISLSNNNGEIFVYIINDDSLNTSKIVVEVWRKSDFSRNYDEFIEIKKFKIEPGWFDTFFKYKFDRPGDYKISLYNENETLIKASYIAVNK